MAHGERRSFGLWWMWVLALTIATMIVFWVLSAAGFVGGTVLEREVFERSHQYCQARQSQIATYEAQLAELDGQILTAADDDSATGLKAQKRAINIKLTSERNMMEGC